MSSLNPIKLLPVVLWIVAVLESLEGKILFQSKSFSPGFNSGGLFPEDLSKDGK